MGQTFYDYNLEDIGERYVRQTGTGEIIYICPWCPSTNPDTKGHLYVNPIKGVGECKKCQSTVRLRNNVSRIRESVEKLKEKQGGDEDDMGISLSEVLKTTEGLGYKTVNKFFFHQYLGDRNIPGSIAVEANVMYNAATGELLFPFINPFTLNTISGWAIRKPHNEGWMNTKSARKNIYIPTPVVAQSKYLVVVEGVADALSLYARGYPAIAIGGTTMTALQLRQLLIRQPKNIDLLMDKDATAASIELSKAISAEARYTLEGELAITIVECPVKDPAILTWEDLSDVMENKYENIGGQTYAIAVADLETRKPDKVTNGVDIDRQYRGDYL